MPRLFGEKFRYLRRQLGITQTEFAHRLGLTAHGHITNLETGRDTASLELVVRAAQVCGVTTDYLLRDTIPVEVIPPSANTLREAGTEFAQLLGRKLRVLHLERGWGQTEFARQLGLAR